MVAGPQPQSASAARITSLQKLIARLTAQLAQANAELTTAQNTATQQKAALEAHRVVTNSQPKPSQQPPAPKSEAAPAPAAPAPAPAAAPAPAPAAAPAPAPAAAPAPAPAAPAAPVVSAPVEQPQKA